MVTATNAKRKYGEPELEKCMMVWIVPSNIQKGVIPKKIYCNRDMVAPLTKAFTNLIERGFINELKTWDGCFNIRKKRGSSSRSLHSWGIAIDVNAATNGWGMKPTLSSGFVQCFKDAGFEWGGDWVTIKDGMHFQLIAI